MAMIFTDWSYKVIIEKLIRSTDIVFKVKVKYKVGPVLN
jgi:hypothetical protein